MLDVGMVEESGGVDDGKKFWIDKYPGWFKDPYREVRVEVWDKDRVCREIVDITGGKILGSRAFEISRCGEVVAVRECEDCGVGRPESGSYRGVHRTCGGRTCPYCSWVRAQERYELLRVAADEIPKVEGHVWQHLIQTVKYDIDRNSDDLSVEGLRSRALYCIRLAKKHWEKHLKFEGAAMLRSVELSARGHVHLHMVYYGPEVDSAEMENLSWKFGSGKRGGRVIAKTIKGGAAAVAKVARYITKSVPGNQAAFNEDFMAEEKTSMGFHPSLAAKWEVATYRLRLTGKNGTLYGYNVPSQDVSGGPHDDRNVACECCGSVGQWKTSFRNAHGWFFECQYKGKAGLEGGHFVPYWKREALKTIKKNRREKYRETKREEQRKKRYEDSPLLVGC